MGTIVTYNGNQSDPVKRNTAYLPTAGKYMTGDITITDTGMDSDDCVYQDKDGFIVLNDSYGTYVDKETLEVTANGAYTAPERKTWDRIEAKVPGSELFKSIVDRTITEIKAEDLEGIETITAHAFCNCYSLVSVNLPDTKSVGADCFYSCSNLVNINMPNLVETLGESTFQLCSSLTTVNVPKLATIKPHTFQSCTSLEAISLPSVTTIANYTFHQCNKLKNVSIPNATSIGSHAFNGCSSLESVDFPKATKISGYAFANTTNITSIKAYNVTSIDARSFDYSGVTTLVFPNITTGTWWAVIYYCEKLESFDIYGPQYFWEQTFNGCQSLTKLIVRKPEIVTLQNISVFGHTPFASDGTGGTLYVPSALIESYQSATNWSTILSYENNQILPIEGSIYETQYADGTPIT